MAKCGLNYSSPHQNRISNASLSQYKTTAVPKRTKLTMSFYNITHKHTSRSIYIVISHFISRSRMPFDAGSLPKDGTTTPNEVKLEMPLFAHECFTAHPTADDRIDREPQDNEPLYPPKECLQRVFSRLSQRLLKGDSMRCEALSWITNWLKYKPRDQNK